MDWYGVKEWLEAASGLHMDALHVHAGILAQLGAAAALRRSLRSPLPWLVVLSAILANEWYDLAYEVWPTRDAQYGESAKDIWNTMLAPTLFFLLARWAPGLLVGGSTATTGRDRAASAEQDG
jgi:hypothetical protein